MARLVRCLTGRAFSPIVGEMKSICPAAALVLVLVACGPADRDLEEPVSLKNAVAATEEAGTGRTETVVVSNVGSKTWTTRSTGVHDYRSGRSEITWEFEGRRSRTIFIDEISYGELHAGELLPSAPGKRWVRHEPLTEERFEELSRGDCDEAGESGVGAGGDASVGEDEDAEEGENSLSCSYILISTDSSMGSEDPGKMLDFLGEYGSSLQVVAREDVRGVPTAHARTLVDFRRASEAWYAEEGWSRENIDRALENEPTQPVQVDVWVDGDGLVRRVRTRRTYEPPEHEQFELPEGWDSSTSVTTTEYFDFGVEVEIHPPPASEVVNAEELARSAEAEAEAAAPAAAEASAREPRRQPLGRASPGR
jgi:hypothetical protein